MSWKEINEVIGLAIVDDDFRQHLLENPLAAIRTHGLALTADEEAFLATIKASDIAEFSQIVLAKFSRHSSP